MEPGPEIIAAIAHLARERARAAMSAIADA
jgi:hypothetical protein